MKISALFTSFFFLCHVSYCQEVPTLDTFRLNTGLKVYLLQCGEDPILNVRLVIEGGKSNEGACQVGYSEIIQRLLDISIQEKHLVRGEVKHQFNCRMNDELTVLQGNCSVGNFDQEMGLLNSTIVRLIFDKGKIDEMVSLMVDHYKPETISATDLSTIYKDFVLYGDRDPMGRKYCQYQVEKVLPVELREFYVRHYTPESSSLIICGNFNVGKVRKIIAKHFIKWRPLRKAEETCARNEEGVPGIKGKEIAVVNKHQMDKYVLKWIFPAPSAKSDALPVFNLLCKLFDSYLLNTMEEQGLKNLNFRPISHKRNFMEINCFSELNDVTAAVELLESTLNSFRKRNFSKKEIDTIIQILKKSDNESQPTKVLEFFDPVLYDFRIRKNYQTNLSNVTVQDLQKTLQKYFSSNSYKLIVVGKEHLISGQLEKFGKVKKFQTSDFETCDESCKEIVIIKYHCESCRRRGFGYVWRFNPADKEAIERARARKE